MHAWLAFLAHAVSRKRRWIIAITLVGFAVMLVPLGRVRFSTDVLDLIPQHLGVLQSFRDLDRHFDQGGDIVVLLETDPSDEAALRVFERRLGDELRAMPEIRSVTFGAGGIVDPKNWQWLYDRFWLVLEREELDALIGKLQPDQIRRTVHRNRVRLSSDPSSMWAQQISRDPLGISEIFLNHLQSSFGSSRTSERGGEQTRTFQILSLITQIELGDSHAAIRLVDKIREREREVRETCQARGVDVGLIKTGYTGRVVLTAEIASRMRFNMAATGITSLLLVGLLFWLAFRSPFPLVAIAGTLVVAVLTTVSLSGILFGGFNVITGSFAAILVALGVDYGIMIYNRYAHYASQRGRLSPTGDEPIEKTARAVFPGILLSATTTAAAFLGIAWTSSPGFRQFGFIVPLGIVLCALLMVFFYFSLIAAREPRLLDFDVFTRLLRRLADWLPRRRRGVAILSVVLILAALGLVLTGPPRGGWFDADPSKLRFGHSAAFETLDHLLAKLDRPSGPVILLVSGKTWPAAMQRTEALCNRLEQARAEGLINTYESPCGLIASRQRQRENAKRLVELDWKRIHATARAALEREGFRLDQFQSFFVWLEALGKAAGASDAVLLTPAQWLQQGGDAAAPLRRYVSHDPNVFQTASYVYPTSPLNSLDAVEDLGRKLGVDGESVRLTNWDALILEMQPLFRRDATRISAVVFGAIVVILLVVYRRAKQIMLAVLPFGGALLCMLAVMKAFGIKFNLANFFAVPIVIGAGVDYAIHILNAFREEGSDAGTVVRVTGKAILLNALTTSIGFGSLVLTDHNGLATLGLLTATGIFFCLFFSLMTLPACIGNGSQ